MRIQRFLAAAWATVHGPSDPRNLLLSLLDNGFAGLSASPGPRAVDWSAVRAAADDLPIGFAGVRAAGPLSDSSPLNSFSSEVAGELEVARRAVSAAVTMARTLGAPLVVLDLGVVSVLGDIECEDLGAPGDGWAGERAQALLARRNVGRDAAVELARSSKLLVSEALAVRARVQVAQGAFGSAGGASGLQWDDYACKQRVAEMAGRLQGPAGLQERLLLGESEVRAGAKV